MGLLADRPGDADRPGSLALGYATDQLPTFVAPPPTLPSLRLAHASCRTPHHTGPDALAWLDDQLKPNAPVPADRPQQLFLTGDQIYADDVAGALLPMLNGLGTRARRRRAASATGAGSSTPR